MHLLSFNRKQFCILKRILFFQQQSNTFPRFTGGYKNMSMSKSVYISYQFQEMSILIYPDMYRDLQNIRYLGNTPILVGNLSDESENYGIAWVRRDPQGSSRPPFGLGQDSLKNHTVCWLWPMTVLSSRCFSIPPRIFFSLILQDTEVRLNRPAVTRLNFLAPLENCDICQLPVNRDLSRFPKLFENLWERSGNDSDRSLSTLGWIQSGPINSEIQLEQQIPQVQGWLGVYHSRSHGPAVWGPSELVISVDDWGRERIWYLCSMSLFVRRPSSSSKRVMFFLVCPLPLIYFKTTELDIWPLKLSFFLGFFLVTTWPEFS